MRVLITGVSGFVGGHLLHLLAKEGTHELHGLVREASTASIHPALATLAKLHTVNVFDVAETASLLKQIQPEWIFHLAGYANAGRAYREPELCLQGNLHLTRAFYDAIQQTELKPRILFTSTGLVYGDTPRTEAISEEAALAPVGPYAAAKAAADLYSYQYFRTFGLPILRVRMFNQIGPGQSADYAASNFAKQIAQAELGHAQPHLQTGDLSAYRDLTDIRDMVRAFRLLIERGTPGEAYNAGSGVAVQIQTVLERLLAQATLPIQVEQKRDPNRPIETAILRADTTKLSQATGWATEYTLEQTLQDLLNDWRARLRHTTLPDTPQE